MTTPAMRIADVLAPEDETHLTIKSHFVTTAAKKARRFFLWHHTSRTMFIVGYCVGEEEAACHVSIIAVVVGRCRFVERRQTRRSEAQGEPTRVNDMRTLTGVTTDATIDGLAVDDVVEAAAAETANRSEAKGTIGRQEP